MILGLRAFVRGVVPTIGGSRLLLIALCVAAVGDAGAYWGDGWELGSQIFATVEFLALPLVIAGAVRFGYVLVRRGPRPRWVGWVVLASGAARSVSLGLTNYWPHGVLVPIATGIAVLSVVAPRRQRPPPLPATRLRRRRARR